MSQAGYTPISLYYSTTAAATPSAGNLVAGELALNTVDEKLYFKNSAGTVKLLASNATSAPVTTFSAGSTGLTPNTATTGAVTLAGTLAVANGGTGLTAGTSGGVLAYTAAGTLASSSALAASALVIGGGAGAAPSTTTTGTGVVTALGVNTGSAGAFVVNGGALGTPSSGTVTNLTGTASININGTVGATTATTGAFTTLSATKAAAGNVITWTNGGATPVAGALYSGASNIYFGGSAGNDGFYIAPGTNVECYVNGVSRLNLTATGLNSTVIGATTPAAGTFTSVSAGSGAISGGAITGSGNANIASTLRSTGVSAPASGAGAEVFYSGGNAYFQGYDRTGSAFLPVFFQGLTIDFLPSGVLKGSITSTGLNSMVIGATTPAAGSFTTLTTTNGATLKTVNDGFVDVIDTSEVSGQGTGIRFANYVATDGFRKAGIFYKSVGDGASRGNLIIAATASITSQNVTSADAVITVVGSTLQTQIANGLAVTGGTLSATYLLDLSAATAGQIKFPATQNASADANTLDDYEEGDWTPSLTFGGGSTGITYDTTNTTATYRKIGSLVMITGYLGLTSKGSSTGDARINTLPFPVKSGKEGYSPVAANRTDSIISIGTINPIAFAGTSGLYFYSTSAAGVATSITDTGFANNSTIYFSFSYATS